ncbi:MAG: tRNA (adenosine(37)-N6)-threonylcarbamoyltransferase complex ATPase subunit type 1 TsaE [Bacteroidota bacterium]
MNHDVFHILRLDDYHEAIGKLTTLMSTHFYFALTGDLGAGKTTLVKKWMHHIGVTDEVTSPTFSLINEYQLDDSTIYHMDLYRIKSDKELIEIGIEEYLYQGAHLIIEWPELILSELTRSLLVQINIESMDEARRIELRYM